MKKFLSMVAIASFMMTASCSDDDSSETVNQANLVKRTIVTGNGEPITTNYVYDGNKIISSSTSDGTVINYTYTGNLITEVKEYDDEDIYKTHVYTYTNDNKLATHTMYSHYQNYAVRKEYTFNANNNTITVRPFSGDFNSQTNSQDPYILTITGNNITALDKSAGEIITYTYDTGLNPFYNIEGYQVINFTNIEGGINNVTTVTHNVESENVVLKNITYTYNSTNYPVSANITDIDSPSLHVEIFYE